MKLLRKSVSAGISDTWRRASVFTDLKMAYIDEGVRIGRGTTIYPCAVIEGNVTIGENCVIGQNTQDKGFCHRRQYHDTELCDT